MLNKNFLFFGLALFLVFSCNKFKESKGGLQYHIVKDAEGRAANLGDMIVLDVIYQNEIDTFDTYKRGMPLNALLDSTSLYPGSLEEGLLLLSAGDSAVFKVKNKIIYNKSLKIPMPAELDSNGVTMFYVKVDTIYFKDEVDREVKKVNEEKILLTEAIKIEYLDSAHVQKQLKTEEKILSKYIKDNKINATKTENGVYVIVADSGKGKPIEKGDKVYTDYVGKFLDGRVFESSGQFEKPFDYVAGSGNSLFGWDEGLMGLKSGAKVTLVIPSPLAFKNTGIPTEDDEFIVPPDTPVIFEIYIRKIERL